MILIADGGSTKADWCLLDREKEVLRVFSKGINPYYCTKNEISDEIRQNLFYELKDFQLNTIYFYGAGCASPEKKELIKKALAENFKSKLINVESDLLGAAIGLCGNNSGIVAILGTGSNSCFYNGEKIVENISPLGYILGDEGSGAVLGRIFIGECLKNQLTKGIKEKFLKKYNLDVPSVLHNVYKKPMPNRFLADFSFFIKENIDDKSVYNLVYNSFMCFFQKNLMQYDYKNHKIYFTGSIAFFFQDILQTVANELNINIETIEQTPMSGLIQYYSKHYNNK